ncbi:MAG: glycosyltransferase family 39 protein, partial [bacterium]
MGIVAASLLILLRFILFREIDWLGKIDVILTLLILIDFLILVTILNEPKLKVEKFWLWVLIILWFYNIVWGVSLKYFPYPGIQEFNATLYYSVILLGLMSLRFVRKKIYNYFTLLIKENIKIENENSKEKIIEMARQNEFTNKFKTVNKIPFIRNIASFFYKQGNYYSLGLIIAVIVLIALSLPLFGRFLNDDEFHLFNVGKGIVETHQCIAWNFLQDAPGYSYPNDCLISNVISVFFLIFGTSLFSAKIPFLIFSVINVFLLYFLGKKIFNKNIALALILFYCTNPFFVYHAGYIRIYAMLITFSLLVFIYILKLFEKNKDNIYSKTILYTIILISLLFIGYKLRITFITIVPGTLLLISIKVISLIKNKSLKTYLFCGLLTGIIAVPTLMSYYQSRFSGFYDYSGRFDWHTFNITLLNFDPQIAKLFFLALTVICLLFIFKKYIQKNTKHSKCFSF